MVGLSPFRDRAEGLRFKVSHGLRLNGCLPSHIQGLGLKEKTNFMYPPPL